MTDLVAGAGDIPPVQANVFRLRDDGDAVLLGARCATCGRRDFPYAALCTRCGGDNGLVDIGSRGVVYSHTTVRAKPPFGLPNPYSVAFIDLEDAPLRIFSLLDPQAVGSFAIGQPVVLGVAAIGDDGRGQPCLRPYFKALSDGR